MTSDLRRDVESGIVFCQSVSYKRLQCCVTEDRKELFFFFKSHLYSNVSPVS